MAKNYDGSGGGTFTHKQGDGHIGKIDGKGDWVINGEGQDLVIEDKKDGEGSAILRNFGNIVIKNKKDGDGTLRVESSASFKVHEVNGNGDLEIYIAGAKSIDVKDGEGDVFYTGLEPSIGVKNGNGLVEKRV